MKTPGVTVEQAKAFRSKLWQLHVDSQRAAQQGDAPSAAESDRPDTILGHLTMAERSSSRELDTNMATLPFEQRVRPGMVVSWTPPPDFPLGLPGGMNLAMVLCPANAAGHGARNLLGDLIDSSSVGQDETKAKAYLCALIMPGIMSETYEVNLWRQVDIEVGSMNAEVCLEYDPATRYYYIAV